MVLNKGTSTMALTTSRWLTRTRSLGLAAMTTCLASAAGAQNRGPVTQAAPPPAAKSSTAADRVGVDVTVYNQNFGLVREVRDVELGTGKVMLEFRDVAAQIQPETVSVKSVTTPGGFAMLEQNYRFDLLTGEKLLEKFVGAPVRLYRWNEKAGREDFYDAQILSVAGGRPVYRVNGEVTTDFPGRVAFSKVPDNLIAKPTLAWLVDSKAQRHRLEATYLTQGISWKADYVLVIDENDSVGDLTGWVTLSNQSGASYRRAQLKLVAGDVQRVAPEAPPAPQMKMRTMVADSAQYMKEESFFEYHLYSLERPTDVLENEQKQVTLLEARGAKITKKLIFAGQQYWFRSQVGQVVQNQKVGVFLDLENRKENQLGLPLPKGVVRVYKADRSGARQFIGEDQIDHTPKDEKVRVKMGEAFDVVADRKQMEWKALGVCQSESAWEIELRNHKNTAVVVEIDDPVGGGDWQVVSSSIPATKKDVNTLVFDAKVPANGKTKVTYRIRVRWC